MITAIFGEKNSGKSEFAEDIVTKKGENRYYLATKRIVTEEDKIRVEECKKEREGKDFITIEQDVAIVKAIDKIKWMESLLGKKEGKRVLLINGIPTLVDNEMFLESGETVPHKEVESTILCGIALLKEFFDDIVIVSDEKSDVTEYAVKADNEEKINEYLKAMKELNAAIRTFAEECYELPIG